MSFPNLGTGKKRTRSFCVEDDLYEEAVETAAAYHRSIGSMIREGLRAILERYPRKGRPSYANLVRDPRENQISAGDIRRVPKPRGEEDT